MLLIYTHKITNRFSYTMKHIFVQLLGIEIGFTTKVEDFIKHQGPKITYTKQPLQNEFFIRSNDLLFEQGINDIQIRVQDWEGIPCFFATDERSNIPFDIFSASFYLLSRYEEYLPHVKDELGRFPPETSVAYEHGFLDTPVVDLWSHKFLKILMARFSDIMVKPKKYRFTSIVNVTTSHCFALRGFGRSAAGFFYDLSGLKLSRMVKRIVVWFNPKKDPYDNFSRLVEIHKKFRAKTMFFFQFAAYSAHDKNISIHKNRFRYLIKSVADYSIVSLSASMAAGADVDTLKKEKMQLSNLINRPIKYSRMRYNKVFVPHTYRDLVEAEFTDDYSLGYTHYLGFRAGTSVPFPFYDINLEVQQPIKIHPFAVCDYALRKHGNKEGIFAQLDQMYRKVKLVKGDFILVFSNELLGEKHKINWLELYESLLKRYYV
ncbi:polysaccharide deacetylase family protein [Muricauda sp. SCSIO 64092]|nr:polysaccharide deacetylase family protein [Muricauda sp. SCSIO 64092]